jgi:hypothetical protein
MKYLISALTLLLLVCLIAGCAVSLERQGQRLFAGCIDRVDDKASLKSGGFVCKGERDPAPFGGNGRSCGDCHAPGDNFGLSVERIATLRTDHPLFFPHLDEDWQLLLRHGLFHVVVTTSIDEFRPSPKLVHLKSMCDENGNCDSLGLRGDRVNNLCVFSIQAVINHLAKSVNRVTGTDFRLPTPAECEALTAYMISDLVAKQDERNR